MLFKFSLLLLLSVTLAGCATMISGTTQEMSFQSSPDTVVVTLIRSVPEDVYWQDKTKKGTAVPKPQHDETRILGKTPLTLQLDRIEEPQSIVFSKEGYKPVTMKLKTRLNGWFWGNIVFGGFFGSTTDTVSGAAQEYEPSQFFVTLTPELATPIEQGMGQAQRDKARGFIVRRYTSLMTDLSKGSGDDLTALLSLLHIDPAQEADAQRKIWHCHRSMRTRRCSQLM